jgi:hypothetical protein
MISDLLTDTSAGLLVAVVRETTQSYFPFSEAGRSPRFTGKMLRNNLDSFLFLKDD